MKEYCTFEYFNCIPFISQYDLRRDVTLKQRYFRCLIDQIRYVSVGKLQ